MVARKSKIRKDGKPYASSTGKRNPRVDQSNWRTKLQTSRIKFDDDQKEVYVRTLAETGLKGASSRAAGVSGHTVNMHIDNDPDFAEAVDAAMEVFNDSVETEVVRRGQHGWEEPIFHKGARAIEPVLNVDGSVKTNKDGETVYRYTTVTKFSDRLLELQAKKTNPAYRDKQTIDLNAGGGGVLLAPAGTTPEEELAEAERVNAEAAAKREREAQELASKGSK